MAASSAILAGKAAVEVGLRSKIDQDARKIQFQLKVLSKSFRDLGTPLAAIGSSGALAGLGILSTLSVPVRLAADMELTSSAFETMLKSADKTKALLGELTKFAAQTPFEFPELADTAKLMIAFGSSSDSVVNELRMIGDVSSAIGQPIKDIALIYGKARTSGRLFASDINELGGRGVPIIRELAKQFNVSESEVRGLVESGKVGFPQLQQVFRDLTSGAGQFAGGMEKASKTTSGQWSSMKDAIVAAIRPIGDALLPTVKSYIATITAVAGRVQTWVEANKELIPTIAKAVVGITAASAAIGGIGITLIAVSSSFTAMQVIVGGVAGGVKILANMMTVASTSMGFLSASQAINTASARLGTVAQENLATSTAKSSISLSAMTSATAAAGSATAKMAISVVNTVSSLNAYVIGLSAATSALASYSAAAATAASIPIVDIGGFAGKKSKRKSGPRGPRKKKQTEVDTGVPGQSLIVPRGKAKASSQPAGYLEGPASSIMPGVGAAAATAAAVVATETGAIAAAFSMVSGAASTAATAIGSVFSGIAAAVGTSVAGVVIAGAAIAAAVGYVANRAGLITKAYVYVSRIFTEVFETGKKTFSGLYAAITNGRWDLAGKIAVAALKLAFVAGLDELLTAMWNWQQTAFDSILDFGLALRDTLWDLFKQIPRLLKAALTGAESIGDIIGDAIAGRLGSKDSLLGKTREQLSQELNQLTAEAAKLSAPTAGPSQAPKQQAPSAIASVPSAATGTANPAAAVGASTAAATPEVNAAQERIAALRKEIETMRLGSEAAELLELARAGATRQELLAVAALQRGRLETEKLNQKRQAEADALKQQQDALKSSAEQLIEASKTPVQKYQERVAEIQTMQKSGLINREQAASGYSSAIGELRSSNPNAGQVRQPNTFARAGSAEAAATIQASRERLLRQAQGAQTAAQANKMAAAGVASPAALRVAGKPTKDQDMLKLQQDQLRVLQEIQKGIAAPVVKTRVT